VLSDQQIEELGWAKSLADDGTFLFESSDDIHMYWSLRKVDDSVVIVRAVPDHVTYKGDVDSQMELYDIMVDAGILPKEED